MDEIRRALGDRASRVLTITGAPGVGKTALALEIAWREAGRDRFDGGVIWLNGFTAAREAWTQIADALGLGPTAIRRAQSHLRDHSRLLVLDAPTAGDAAFEFVNALASEETKVLVAGEKLGLAQSELVWELDALEFPAAFDALGARWGARDTEGQGQALPLQPNELNADAIETARALADDYAGDGENETALAVLGIALRLARQIHDKKRAADCLTNIGLIYRDQGDLDKALEYLEQSLALARELGSKQGEANQLGNIGLIYTNRGDLDKALEYHEQALALDRELGYKQGEASDLGNIGLIYRDKGDLDKALEYFASTLVIQGITADAQNITQGNIARVREKIGEREFDALAERVTSRLQQRFDALADADTAEQSRKFVDAANALSDARATFDEKKLDAFEWREYAQLGWRRAVLLKKAGRLLEARTALRAAFDEFARGKEEPVLGRLCLEMGNLARAMDNYGDAWIHYTDAYRLFKRAGNKRMMAAAREEAGTLEYFFRQPRACADLEEARRLYSQVGERVRARTVEQLLREARAVYATAAEGKGE